MAERVRAVFSSKLLTAEVRWPAAVSGDGTEAGRRSRALLRQGTHATREKVRHSLKGDLG